MTDSKTPDWAKEEAEKAMLDSPICMITTADWDAAVLLISQALLSAYERGKAEREWQTIETARDSPDGKLRVLVFDPTQRNAIGVAIADGKWWRKNAKSRGPHTAPTHWMPLPAPPAIRQLLEVKG